MNLVTQVDFKQDIHQDSQGYDVAFQQILDNALEKMLGLLRQR